MPRAQLRLSFWNPMTDTYTAPSAPDGHPPGDAPRDAAPGPQFILYLDGQELERARNLLAQWVNHLLVPVYVRAPTSSSPWCPRWWLHADAVAHLYGLWMAWQELTDPRQGLCGPAIWHRDHLGPALRSLRDPSGPFAGCRPGTHRTPERTAVEDFPTT